MGPFDGLPTLPSTAESGLESIQFSSVAFRRWSIGPFGCLPPIVYTAKKIHLLTSPFDLRPVVPGTGLRCWRGQIKNWIIFCCQFLIIRCIQFLPLFHNEGKLPTLYGSVSGSVCVLALLLRLRRRRRRLRWILFPKRMARWMASDLSLVVFEVILQFWNSWFFAIDH